MGTVLNGAVGDEYARPTIGKLACDAATDTCGSTGNDGDLVRKSCHVLEDYDSAHRVATCRHRSPLTPLPSSPIMSGAVNQIKGQRAASEFLGVLRREIMIL